MIRRNKFRRKLRTRGHLQPNALPEGGKSYDGKGTFWLVADDMIPTLHP